MIARPHSARALLLAVFLVLLAIPAGLPGPTPEARAAGVSETKELSRQHVNPDGSQGTPENNGVSVNVSQLDGLQGRQRIEVTWSGAKPTQGYLPGVEAASRFDAEYPVMLVQCRGVDTASTPIDPRNCLTSFLPTRIQEDYLLNLADPVVANEGAPWILDRYAPAQDRAATPPIPAGCADLWGGFMAVHFLPFVDAAGKSWKYCLDQNLKQDIPPDVSVDSALPPNDQFAITDTNGSGRAIFEVRRKEQSASLGCSETVACSLVVVPITGISCDLRLNSDATMRQMCASTGNHVVGPRDLNNGQPIARAVKGDLWWSGSNWRNRFSFKLGFAPTASFCNVNDTRSPVDFYGSEIIGEATLQWAPAFCLDKSRFKLRHQRAGEPRAKTLLDSGGAAAAFVGRPPDQAPTRSTVYGPAAVSGFVVGYYWKEAGSQEAPLLQDLKLTPRLLAKLITQSYPASLGKTVPTANWLGHPTVGRNPQNMSVDPEFQKLNPRAGSGDVGAAALTAISPNSDVIWELTRYINADPAARAWLDGVPDENGMVVNPKFRGMKLPFEAIQLLDDWIVPNTKGLTVCADEQPTQFLNQVASPLSNFGATGYAGLDGQPSSLTDCPIDSTTQKYAWKRTGRGQATVALMSLADADLYKVPVASLQTRPGSFVKPNLGSMRTATRLLKKDAATSTWSLDQGALRSSEIGKNAYPGTMIIYTAATTEKLDEKIAKNVAQFMRFSVTEGQTPGTGNGKLPEGYLPITEEGGLGFLIEQTMKAADAVENQVAEPEPEPSASPTPTPSSTNPDSPPPGGNNNAGNGNNGNGNNNNGNNNPPPGGNGTNNPPGFTATTSPTGSTTPSPNLTGGPVPSNSPNPGQEEAERALTSAATRADQSFLARWALPMLLLAGLVGGVLAPLISTAARPGHPVRIALAKAMARLRK